MNNYRLSALLAVALLPTVSRGELVGYWKLDGNFEDSSGNGNNGEFFGGTAYQDEAPTALGGGQSVSFDGLAGTYGAINAANGGLALSTRRAFSISMWVKGDGTLNSDDRVFSEGSATNNNPLFNVGTHNTGADGTVDFYIRNGGGAQTLNHAHSFNTAFDDTWHHILCVSNDKIIDLYVDGVLDGQYDYAMVPDFTDMNTTTIGGILRAGDCCNFLGSIDEVAVWDHALSAEDAVRLADGVAADEAVVPPADADGDGLPDEWELSVFNNLNETGQTDPDNDQLSNAEEFELGTDPTDPDTDDDGLEDGAEIAAQTGPKVPDSDSDGLLDGDEVARGTNPLSNDSDQDGIQDNVEVLAGSDPTDPTSVPGGEEDSLIAYWPLDETDGTTTPDLGPHGYPLELRNMDETNFVEDEGRTVATFDGFEEFLVRASTAGELLPITQHPSFTISMWVKVLGEGQNDLRIFSESSDLNNDPLFNIGTRNNGSDNTVDIYLRDNGSPNHQWSTAQPLDGTWHHLAYTHDDATMTIQLYVDGVLDRDNWTFKDVVSTDVNQTTIGAILRAAPSHWVNGMVDDVSVWSSVLSAPTIADLAAGGTPNGLVSGGAGFAITSINRTQDGAVELKWNSRSNKTYILEASADLQEWVEIDDSIESQGEETTYVFPPGIPGYNSATDQRLFFRVRQ